MTRIKICGLTTLEDARWAWRCGADLLGFILVPASPRYIPAARVAEITRALTAEGCAAQYVGVFAGEPLADIRRAVQVAGLHLAQLHGEVTPAEVEALGWPVILARRIRARDAGPLPWDELARYPAWACLLDGYDPHKLGGTGQTWDWSLARGAPPGWRVIIAGGLTPENVGQAIRQARPWGVDVSSGVERSPGRKDHAAVERFIQRVREEETT